MKKIALLAGVALLFCSNMAMAQKKTPAASEKKAHNSSPVHRCHTMEEYERMFRTNPAYKAQFEANQARIMEKARTLGTQRTASFTDTIPVVIHVVGNASLQAQVTDAILQSQIDVLNEDYQGMNADSTRIPAAFKPLFGKMGLTFMLAKSTPTSASTNGIDRRTISSTFTAGTADNAKKTSTGGLDAWDPNRYLNLWVVTFTDNILGISVFPGDPKPLNLHGFVCDYRAFGRGANYLYADFNKGRTTSHELGHFWNLRHIWGDDGGSCSGTDFPGAPAGQDDTPNQAEETFGNMDPAGNGAIFTDACTSTGQGIMYQNYMDYSDDIALVMFTKGQVTRMETALTSSPDRMNILNSNAYMPPFAWDASLSILTPTNNLSFCNSNSINPVVTLSNYGSNTLTSATFTSSVDGGTPVLHNWTGTLTAGQQVNVTLPGFTGLGFGAHTLNICITSINGGQAEGDVTNNCKTNTFTIINASSSSIPGPINEGFESTTFAPAGWTVETNTSGSSWMRNTTAAKTGAASARINWYEYEEGVVSDLVSPMVNFAGKDAAFLTFNYAYKLYSTTSYLGDTLEIQVSPDCGGSWTTVWKRGGTQLATVGGGTGNISYTPAAADWTATPISVNLNAYINTPFTVRFRARSGWGQNLYLDDINLFGAVYKNNDAGITAINNPAGEFCSSTKTPQVVVKNFGYQPLTSIKVNTILDNGTVQTQSFTGLNVAMNATTILDLSAITGLTNGSHSFRAYTSEPNNVTDEAPANDTTSNTFVSHIAITTFPITEGFENTTFPSNGWSVVNVNNDGFTWSRTTQVRKSGTASVFMNNYLYNQIGAQDYLRSPLMDFAGNDTAYLTFHYANKLYASSADGLKDTLEVVVSSNCGTSWTSVWKRGGTQLATVTGVTGDINWGPAASDWTQTPISVNLSAFANSGPLFVAIRSKNGYGQNVFLDDITIVAMDIPDYEVTLTQVVEPFDYACAPTLAPRVRVRNQGRIALSSIKVNYKIDNGSVVSQTFNNLNLQKNRDTVLVLNTIAPQLAGSHSFKFYSSEPNGQADQFPNNDTLTKIVNFREVVTGGMVEGFENTFLPNGWDINQQPVDALTWQKTTKTGRNSNASVWMRNWIYNGATKIDDLVTPPLSNGVVDSVFLTFDLAATYSNILRQGRDTLEVLMTTDCGNTYTTLYKKSGTELHTIGNINTAPVFAPTDTLGFVPVASQWRTEVINLSPYMAQGGMARFVFRNKSNYDNNIFIDNVKFTTRIVPENVKLNGYVVYPNPFTTNVGVWHYEQPQDLRFISVYTTSGSLIWSKQFNGNAEKFVPLDLKNAPAGIYVVRLGYSDENKNKSDRIIKLQ